MMKQSLSIFSIFKSFIMDYFKYVPKIYRKNMDN